MSVSGRYELKHPSRIPALSLVLLTCVSFTGSTGGSQPELKQTPVLLELFTSEGCSSCPPADEFLARLDREQPVPGVEIIGMEEHVDYWNHDGWVDPYSSAEWTSRQLQYVQQLKENTAYTPELVIDGECSVIGAREREILLGIQESARRESVTVAARLNGPPTAGALKVEIRVEKIADLENDTPEIWLAIAEKHLGSHVGAGENAGRQLRHSAVLRSLKKIGNANAKTDLAYNGTAEAKVSRDWRVENLQAIVIVQEKKSRRVVGVTAIQVAAPQ